MTTMTINQRADAIHQQTSTINEIQRVVCERRRQDRRFGGPQTMSYPEWGSVLMEEVGELATELNDLHWPKTSPNHDPVETLRNARTESIHVAAVAVRIAEQLTAELTEMEADDDAA